MVSQYTQDHIKLIFNLKKAIFFSAFCLSFWIPPEFSRIFSDFLQFDFSVKKKDTWIRYYGLQKSVFALFFCKLSILLSVYESSAFADIVNKFWTNLATSASKHSSIFSNTRMWVKYNYILKSDSLHNLRNCGHKLFHNLGMHSFPLTSFKIA